MTFETVHSGDCADDGPVNLTVDNHIADVTLGVETLASAFPGATNVGVNRDGSLVLLQYVEGKKSVGFTHFTSFVSE
jgi:hypothetical protein